MCSTDSASGKFSSLIGHRGIWNVFHIVRLVDECDDKLVKRTKQSGNDAKITVTQKALFSLRLTCIETKKRFGTTVNHVSTEVSDLLISVDTKM